MKLIEKKFLVKHSSSPDYYLGNHFHYIEKEKRWTYDCTTYCKEAVSRIERDIGTISSKKTPYPVGDCCPELDNSALLNKKDHRFYQQLIGMGIWLTVVGRPDICYAILSLSRFSSCPRCTHLDMLIRVFGYLKYFPNKRIAIDSTPINMSKLPKVDKLQPDFLNEYNDAKEDIGNGHPPPRGRELQVTVMCDSDHAHDQKTRRSITGIIVFIGSTPVLWLSKRQGAIATSTYAAEFMALRHGAEEIIHLRYMLQCLGVPVTQPSNLFGDNLGVIQNASNVDAELKKKHVSISFHVVREAIAARIMPQE